MLKVCFLNFLFGHMSFFGATSISDLDFLVTSPLGFKARVGSASFTFAEANVMYTSFKFCVVIVHVIS